MKTPKSLFAGATVAASALLWAACTHGAQLAPGGNSTQLAARGTTNGPGYITGG